MPQWSVGFAALNMNGCKEGDYITLGQAMDDVRVYVMYYKFCSPTSLQSRFATCFNKNNLSGTVELADHYIPIELKFQ